MEGERQNATLTVKLELSSQSTSSDPGKLLQSKAIDLSKPKGGDDCDSDEAQEVSVESAHSVPKISATRQHTQTASQHLSLS